MASFLIAHKAVMLIEGGYANDPDDKGGETYKGIARNFFPRWKGWAIVDAAKKTASGVVALERKLEANAEIQKAVLEFYKAEFWDFLKLDQINDQKISTELYDTGVNMGKEISALFLQQSLNINNNCGKLYPDIAEDKVIGPQTVKLTNEHPRPAELFKTLNIFQGARYIDICRGNPKMEKFWRSWLSRVTTVY